jgi:hypothetical protein
LRERLKALVYVFVVFSEFRGGFGLCKELFGYLRLNAIKLLI